MKRHIFIFIITLLMSVSAHAVTISNITVDGNKRLSKESIIAETGVKKGENIRPSTLNKIIKKLYATDWFEDVNVRTKGSTLNITVKENPTINRISFEGNDEIDDDTLKMETGLKPRQTYSAAITQSAISRMLELYKRSGMFTVSIEPKIIKKDQNRVDLVFEIKEDDKTYIKKIDFSGNEAFHKGKLKEVILSREQRWWRFLSSFDTYDPDRILYDRQLLKQFYLRNGYVDFKITKVDANMTPDRKGYYMHITVEEGPRYKFGDVNIENTLDDVHVEKLKPLIEFKSGEFYNIDDIEKTKEQISEFINNKGYAFGKVDIIPQKDDKKNTVGITFKINKTPKIYINRIDIHGNSRTMDYVIEREFRVKEQDAFDLSKIRRTKQRLMGLRYFKNVDIKTSTDPVQKDRINISTTVEEQPTGELNFGFGWSTLNGAMLDAGIQEKNFMGKGQTLGLTSVISEKRNKFLLSFTEPYFLNRELSAGFDIDYTYYRYSDDYGYDMQSYGASFRLGWAYTEKLRSLLRFSANSDDITNVSTGAPADIQDEEGEVDIYMISKSISYVDMQTDYVNMTKNGIYATGKIDYAGMKGDENFIRGETSLSLSHNFWDKEYQLGFSLTAGKIWPIQDKYIKRSYRYYLGGDNLRGFDIAGIGARSAVNLDYAYGGYSKVNGTLQQNFPVGLPKEYQVSGFIFSDYGWMGEPDYGTTDPSQVLYDPSVRVSIGLGIKWNTPMGEINISWAKAIEKEWYDEIEPFRLSFGTQF